MEERNEFWSAFTEINYIGEGSFGLVFKCKTVDGDVVAVKSCPIDLSNKLTIEDSYSVLKEIAVMRFLIEMQVPYVLPLHSSFYTRNSEALPPLLVEVAEWRRQRYKRIEQEILLNEMPVDAKNKNQNKTLEERVQEEIQRRIDMGEEDEFEKTERIFYDTVKMPKFMSIAEEDCLVCDATVFLVLELCDGDVEHLPKNVNNTNNTIAKGVAYCVSSALAAMHELGILHLDLKPSNILFSYEGHNSNGAVKFYLSDFGNGALVGHRYHDTVHDVIGTYEYMDWRALHESVCARSTDCYSLGASLFEILYGTRIYPKCKKCSDENDHTQECYVEFASRPVRIPVSENNNNTITNNNKIALTTLQKIVAQLLSYDEKSRMTAEQCRDKLIEAFHITQAQN
ncbi:hypothetical protein AGDE_06356 [Angomonas deanei]|uniref:Protein tyrosine kinase/Protein kinase domain containing protein, putative n=1 Tax=Angomonas deanei TaxID=59799 RepID=A0A7G2CS57_9TRYP|nr:hypothetical protein AGDE_06356 [Angomonas deanei]CAD2222626.1 Protein tyrosine kinase/Protein kinase domain containing protein, putative [Angomonas deanei]|eukprot:EPY37578.1 hypothetical protein AGDE_06356 [Angomonas deanei]